MHGVGQRHLDVVAGRQRQHRLARRDALGDVAARRQLAPPPSMPPLPSRSPNVRLRECGDVHVATRSPTPARPASVAGLAPNAIPSRMISASPRVMIAATVFSPSPTPGRHAAGQRDDVLARAADLGADDVGVGVRPEVAGGASARCSVTARPESAHATTVAAGCSSAISLARLGPVTTATRDGSAPVTCTIDLAHPHQRVQLDALGQADQRGVVADQVAPLARGWPAASATAPRAAPCRRRPAPRRRRWWRGSTSAARRRRGNAVAVGVVDLIGELRAAGPQRDVVARVGQHFGQRRAPRTGPHHRRFDHGFNPSLRVAEAWLAGWRS